MAESIPTRVGRIISSSVNALVDALENMAPDLVMEEAIREIDGALDDIRVQLGRTLARKHLAQQRLDAQHKRHAELSEQARVAVRENRDDLAEAAIAQQMDIEVQIPVLEQAVADAEKQTGELENYVAALKAKRREMRDELDRFRASRREADSARQAGPADEPPSEVDGAVSAFERIMEKNSGLPGGNSDLARKAKLAELEELARRNRIRERLAAVKAGGE